MKNREIKRVFLIVLDSFGIGEMPDSADFGDEGSNTLRSVFSSKQFNFDNMRALGFANIEGLSYVGAVSSPLGSYGKVSESSNGKDTTIGHWEISGIISEKPLPTYPCGFPNEVLSEFSKQTGRGVLCNRPYSGTDVIRDFGKEHIETGDLIVYTSADSVFQIAAHEDVVDVDTLYEYCKIARNILTGEHAVGRVIARPFTGDYPNYVRSPKRHDYSIEPPAKTILDELSDGGYDVISVGKINDIFAGRGITSHFYTRSNDEGMAITLDLQKKDFCGLCFTNLVDFDSVYGHRNDVDGYAHALAKFDKWLGGFIDGMHEDDLLIITSDHGCDPGTPSTDHSREYTPLIVYGKKVKSADLGVRSSFSDIAKTLSCLFNTDGEIQGNSFLSEIL